MKIVSAFLLMGFLIAGEMVAQSFHAVVVLAKKSNITIDGTSNITKFRFTQSSDNFIGRCLPIVVTKNDGKLYLDKDELYIPVKGFNSKNKMALRDFYKMLDVDNHPVIRIQLHYIELQPQDDGFEAYVYVDLTITGITQGYTIPVKVSKEGEDYIFRLNKDIDIHDFDLAPPTQMLHLIKVSERININMNVTCKVFI